MEKFYYDFFIKKKLDPLNNSLEKTHILHPKVLTKQTTTNLSERMSTHR